jgi:formiminoglutamase
MDNFKLFTQQDLLSLVNERTGEEKLGQLVQLAPSLDSIKSSTAHFVVLGIPEDIGVRANHGVGGAQTAFIPALKALLNLQSNPFLKGDELLILGHFEIDEPEVLTVEALRQKTKEIDAIVYPVIQQIVNAGKIPIVIGGGHNNAAPIIAGTAIALKQPINVVNIDAHADLRNTNEGRHSGNAFSFAMQQGHLNEYRIFGLHQNYINKDFPAYLKAHPNIKVFYVEELLQSSVPISQSWTTFIEDLPAPCGLEIDLDSISNVLSSAITPSGLPLNDVRKLLLTASKNYSYLHICEGAVSLADGRSDAGTGKTIAYLMTDFIKALLPHIAQQP